MRIHARISAATVLTSLLGVASIQAYPTDPAAQGSPDQPPRMNDKAPGQGLMFVRGSKVRGLEVKNAQEESLGTVDEMIIDRGSGRIRYLAIKSGAVMGLGGRLVTVPYSSFGWDHADKHVVLSATPEQIKSWPEFDKKRWMEGARTDDSFIRTLGKDYYETKGSPWPDLAHQDRQESSHIKGTIKRISRQNASNGHEEMIVVVASPGAPDQEVVLGPSWYLSGNNSIDFYRDAAIEVDTFRTTRAGKPVAIATRATINGRNLAFYDDQGRARWYPNGSTSESDPFFASPFVLSKEIEGKPVDCRGQQCGTVEQLVVECTTGRVAFLSIDPDEAFLGIGDDKRLVPWSVVSRSQDGKVHLDANKSMVSAAPITPDDLKSLAAGDRYRSIYDTYDTQPMQFERSR